MLYHLQLDVFQFLDNVSPLIQEASSVLTNWRGVCRLLNSVWKCPYRVVKDTCELWVSESLGPLVSHWPNWPLCGLLGLGELPWPGWLSSTVYMVSYSWLHKKNIVSYNIFRFRPYFAYQCNLTVETNTNIHINQFNLYFKLKLNILSKWLHKSMFCDLLML